MNVTIFPTPEDASTAVAERILSVVRAKPTAVLGLATGQTPRQVYAKLLNAVESGLCKAAECSRER
ncbi:6-phosphogluconolactonase, partial [Agrobacterium sp. DSM 25558]|uniref:6-phosphogluconolactonase n=1 Tax=Agrobacterium sp. DSM 25558 TaxID=1907665 RepID=UPI00352C3C2E